MQYLHKDPENEVDEKIQQITLLHCLFFYDTQHREVF